MLGNWRHHQLRPGAWTYAEATRCAGRRNGKEDFEQSKSMLHTRNDFDFCYSKEHQSIARLSRVTLRTVNSEHIVQVPSVSLYLITDSSSHVSAVDPAMGSYLQKS